MRHICGWWMGVGDGGGGGGGSDSSGLVTINVLNTKTGGVANKIPHVSGLVKQTDYRVKRSSIEKNILLYLIIINS